MVQIFPTNLIVKPFSHLKLSLKVDISILLALTIVNGISRIYAINHGSHTANTNNETRSILLTESTLYPNSAHVSNYSDQIVDKDGISAVRRKKHHASIHRTVHWREFDGINNRKDYRFKRAAVLDLPNSDGINKTLLRPNLTTTTKAMLLLSQPMNVAMAMAIKPTINSTYKNSTKIPNIISNENQIKRNIFLNNSNSNPNLNSNSLQSIHNDNRSEISILNESNTNILRIDPHLLDAYPNLVRLTLSQNLLISFELSTEKNQLLWLDLSANRLATFNGTTLRKLKMLDLSCNNISSVANLHLNDLNNLEMLDLSGNNLNSLDGMFTERKLVKVLNVAWNGIVEIHDSSFFQLRDIEVLNLAHNNITVIEGNSFADLPNLQYLDLSLNKLYATSISTLYKIPGLTKVSLAHNPNLSELTPFVSAWSLKDIDASGLGLSKIPSALAQSIHTLNISYNNFETIQCGALDSYPQLQRLDISTCHIVEVEEDAFGRLEILHELYMNNNNITHIPLSLPESLVNLYLRNNQIVDLDTGVFSHLTNLQTVDLSGNKLIYLPGLPLPQLQSLDLRRNELKRLSQSIVKMSPNLRDIQLNDNPIKCAEILSIAEWATPCRKEKFIDATSNLDAATSQNSDLIMETLRMLSTSFQIKSCVCRRRRQPNQPQEKGTENFENITTPNATQKVSSSTISIIETVDAKKTINENKTATIIKLKTTNQTNINFIPIVDNKEPK